MLSTLHAQEWKTYTKDQGLPSNHLSDIALAAANQIWIASDSGLTYFDGNSFTNFNTQNSNLPSNNLKELAFVNGNIWMTTDSGLSKYDGRNFTNYNESNGLLQNYINDIAVDTNGTIWIAANRGVSRFDGVTFTHDSGKLAKAIEVDDSNRVYILKYTVVFNIPNSGLTVFEIFNGQNWTSPPMGFFGDYYRSQFYKSPNGKIYFLPSGGGNQFYAELSYPFNLTKRPIITGSRVNRTASFIKEFNGERYINYAGISAIYKGSAKDSSYLPLYLLAPSKRIQNMDVQYNKTVIATDDGLLIGPSTFNTPNYTTYLDINKIKAGMQIQGALFHNYLNSSSSFEYPADSNSHLIYSANFQLGIKRDSNQINFQVYPEEVYNQSYETGPYHKSNQIFGDKFLVKIQKSEIDNHRLNFSQSNYQIPQSILKWPATADSSHFSFPDLAPFFDANQNGCYDPMQGDYPLIKGDQAVYWINHPANKTIPLEYHWMLYGYNRPNDSALNQSVFVQLRIINRDSLAFDYIKPAFRIDADLGSPRDDFNGADSTKDLIYFYNGDSFDENFQGMRGYLGNPPALGIRSLSAPMTSATFYQTRLTSPQPFFDSWTYLHGLNGDSTYFKNPHTSINTLYQFSGDPFANTGWTESNTNPTVPAGNPPGDRRGTMGFPAFSLAPGASHTTELVINVAQKTFRTGTAEYLPLLRNQVDYVKTYFNNQMVTPSNYALYYNCPVVVNNSEFKAEQSNEFQIYPNPSNGLVYLKYQGSTEQVEVRSIDGKLIQVFQWDSNSNSINVSDLQQGIYIIRIHNENGWKQQKLLLLD